MIAAGRTFSSSPVHSQTVYSSQVPHLISGCLGISIPESAFATQHHVLLLAQQEKQNEPSQHYLETPTALNLGL